MATNLLLEGDDLEALLLRAAAEGGSNARILRAEKVRQGGFLGFFAREHFEVAVEIADAVAVPDPDEPPAEPADAPVHREESAIEALVRPSSEDRMPQPVRSAADGLLELADRVSAAEQAPGHDGWWSSMETPAHGIARVTSALSGLARAPGPWDDPAIVVEDLDDPDATGTTDVEAERRLAEDQAAAEAVIRAAVQGRHVAPSEAPAAPGQPATARGEFTTLLATLLPDTPPAPRQPADPWSSPVPTGAMLPPAQRLHVPDPPDEPPADEAEAPDPAADDVTGAADVDDVTGTADVDDVTGTAAETDPAGDLELTAERRALRHLGVPAAWIRRYKGGDRFDGVMRMLDRLPELDIDPDTRIVAVIGPPAAVTMEAHRTALDLAIGGLPRTVVVVPSQQGQARRGAVARAQRLTAGVVAIATDTYDDVESVLDTLQAVGAGAVIVVVEAHRGVEATSLWLEALETVDALVVDGAAEIVDPAAVLQLDLPVVRLDGIPIDRVTWSALLCARLTPGTSDS